ncbi:MAG: VanW family protein [Minisyncoccia bacterium]
MKSKKGFKLSKNHRNKVFLLFLSVIFATLIVLFFQTKTWTKENIANLEVKDTAPPTKSEEIDTKNLDLLGKAELSFAGGTDGRNKNIEIGIEKINGTVIKPGEEFSFHKAIGKVIPEDGWSVEKIFLNGEVKKGLGGGLCQLSSLMFQTALKSGLPVTERQNHSYTVSYYDVGLDATYSDPGPNLKFRNDTKHPISIKGSVEGLTAKFEIYGKSDGRVASTSEAEVIETVDFPPTRYFYVPELEEGQSECVNTPQIGYTAKIKYGVMYPDGVYKEKDFVSKYKPLQRVCYIIGEKIKTFDITKLSF